MSATTTKQRTGCPFCTNEVCDDKFVTHLLEHCTHPTVLTHVVITCPKCSQQARGDHDMHHGPTCTKVGVRRLTIECVTISCPGCQQKIAGPAIAGHRCNR